MRSGRRVGRQDSRLISDYRQIVGACRVGRELSLFVGTFSTLLAIINPLEGHCHVSPVKALTPPFVSSLTHRIRSIRFALRSK